MNIHCECPVAGFCKRHQLEKGAERHKRCRGEAAVHDCGLSYWNAWEQGRLGATAPSEPKLNPEGFCSKSVKRVVVSQIGTKLSEIIKRETGIEVPCETCREMIASLDEMTPEKARAAKPLIVASIVERAPEQAQTIWQRIQITADSVLHTGILQAKVESWFDEAVAIGSDPPPKKQSSAFRSGRVAVAGRASRPFAPQNKPTAEQNRLFAESKRKVPEPTPFHSKPIINLVYHIWPMQGAWHWHAERLRDLIPLCDGKVIIGIAYDNETDSPESVMSAIGDKPQYIVMPNIAGTGDVQVLGKPFGEVATAEAAFPLLRDTGDSITLYAHAKGMRAHTRNSRAVRLWTEMMYETVTFNHEETRSAMERGCDIVGSFRTFGFRPLVPQHQWHYSGTFWNVRTQSLFQSDGTLKPFQQRYGGTEAWPGDHFPAWKAHCVFEENAPWLRQYDLELMKRVIPQQLIWESATFGEKKLEQHKREFNWFMSEISDCKSMLVIGSRHGGIEHYIRKRMPHIKIASVDIAPLPTNTETNMIVGSSHDTAVQEIIRAQGPFDVVFIDGDHSESGVRQDWNFSKSLNPKRIFFHDHTNAEYHAMCDCHVDPVWAEAVAEAKENGWTVSEKVVGCGWGGIGQIKCGTSSA